MINLKKLLLTLACCTTFALICQSQNELWGATRLGGEFDAGVIFKTDNLGENAEIEHHFHATEGRNPEGEAIMHNGKYYGTTSLGGTFGLGTLFEYDPLSDTQVILFHFDGAVNGRNPLGKVLIIDDKIYGTANANGANSYGVLFEYDMIAETYTHLVDFSLDTGGLPDGAVIEYDNALIGLTNIGGEGNDGTMYKYDLETGFFSILYDFDSSNAARPEGSVTLYNDKLYGATYFGGSNDNSGMIFEFDLLTNDFTNLHSFNGTSDGKNPKSEVTVYNDILYGATINGGESNYGVFYQYNLITDEFSELQTFDADNTGREPSGNHAVVDGKIYGMNRGGGELGQGVIYEYDPSLETFNVLSSLGFGNNTTESGLIVVDGDLISMAKNGLHGFGTINRYSLETNTSEQIMNFSHAENGGNMSQSLTYFDGKFYGITEGGEFGVGALFEYDPTSGEYNKRVNFGGTETSGNEVYCTMVEVNGKLYGTTSNGGTELGGVIFEYDPVTQVYLDKLSIPISSGLTIPGSELMVYNGKIYGLNRSNGDFGGGALFEYDPVANELFKRFDFNDIVSGERPTGKLLELNGLFYGVTSRGGINSEGTLFSFDPITFELTKIIDFDGLTLGAQPLGSLIELNGKFYGTTESGGSSDEGVIFEFDPLTNDLNVEMHFTIEADGFEPSDGLVESEGLLFGMTKSGGDFSRGVMYSFDPVNNTYTKKFDFDRSNGSSPNNTRLVKVPQSCVNSFSESTVSACSFYEAPSGNLVFEESGVYSDTLVGQNSCGADSIIQINLTILEPTPGLDLHSACDSFTWIDGNTYTETNTTATHQLTNVAGCDSIVTLILYVTYSNSAVDTQTACDSFTWIDGNTYTEDNNSATHLLTNVAGCDSLVTLNLSINTIDSSISQADAELTSNQANATYQWFNCADNEPIEGATEQVFNAVTSGEYAVSVSSNGCTETSDCISVSVIGIRENDFGAQLQLYPNPSDGKVFIELGEVYEKVQVTLTDLSSKVIFTNSYQNQEMIQMEMTEPAGVYFVIIQSENKKATLRLMKE